MNKDEILSEAKIFISNQLQVQDADIDLDRELKSLGLDSFRIIELVLFLERRTGLQFPDHAYTPSNLKSLGTIVNCFINLQS